MFHRDEAAAERAIFLEPICRSSLTDGIHSRPLVLVWMERAHWEEMAPKIPWTHAIRDLQVTINALNWIWKQPGNQCSSGRSGVICAALRALRTVCTIIFCTCLSFCGILFSSSFVLILKNNYKNNTQIINTDSSIIYFSMDIKPNKPMLKINWHWKFDWILNYEIIICYLLHYMNSGTE